MKRFIVQLKIILVQLGLGEFFDCQNRDDNKYF